MVSRIFRKRHGDALTKLNPIAQVRPARAADALRLAEKRYIR
jgi:hypothetical protein